YGDIAAPLGEWTPTVRIDTDRRSGGCVQQFALKDPTHALDGLSLWVTFTGPSDQCGAPSVQLIPITADGSAWTKPYRIDADSRPGFCEQTFRMSGRSDLAFDVAYFADDDPGQCHDEGIHSMTADGVIHLEIDTDDRPGGCRESFRLRQSAPSSPPPSFQAAAAPGALKIMPLGDSMTYGGDSAGYRAALYR